MSDVVSKIIWSTRGEVKKLRPHPHVSEREIAPRCWEEFQKHLYPGALWVTVNPMIQERPSTVYASHAHPYVMSVAGRPFMTPDIAQGEYSVYIGTIRVHEENKIGIGVMSDRHCFLIKGARYIAASLMDFKPCGSSAE